MAKADLRKVEYGDGQHLVYDADMKMGALRRIMSAGQSGDLEVMFEAFTSIVMEWSYKSDPRKMEAWDDLRKSEFTALNEALMEDLQALGEG